MSPAVGNVPIPHAEAVEQTVADRDEAVDSGEASVGRREANKRDKLSRIRKAASEVFLLKGYEAATVREIAMAANVAFGTIFLYAKNKQDMLLLIFEEDFLALGERAAAKVNPRHGVVDQLLTFFAEFFNFFSLTPSLSRDMLREISFSSSGIVAARIWSTVRETEQHLARLVARAQAAGHVRPDLSPGMVAHLIFSLHRIELRACLDSDTPDVAASLNRLREQLNVVMSGVALPGQSEGAIYSSVVLDELVKPQA